MAGYIGSKSSVTLVDGYTEAEADAEFVNDPNGAITVDGSNVGIGTSSPSSPKFSSGASGVLELKGTKPSFNVQESDVTNAHFNMSMNGGNAYLGATGTGNLVFATGTTDWSERMRIDSSGRVFIGTTSTLGTNPARLEVNTIGSGGRIIQTKTDINGNTNHLTFNTPSGQAGSIYTNTLSTTYSTSSDYRLKENVVDLTGASARVNQLDVKRFNFIADDTNTLVDGFLAHEVADVVPEAIHGTKDAMRDEEYEVTPEVLDEDGNVTTEAVMGTRSVPDYQGIDQSKLVPLLTAALQEALTEIASLKTRVEALEA